LESPVILLRVNLLVPTKVKSPTNCRALLFLSVTKYHPVAAFGTLVQSCHAPPSSRSKVIAAAVSGGRPGLDSS
jgi:hypothetical protein